MVEVPYKRSLGRLSLEKDLHAVLDEKLKSLPNYNELRLNPEAILLCCNCIENSVSKKDKVVKKDLAVKVLHAVFNYTPAEKKSVEDVIQFLHENKRIKKIKAWKKVLLFLVSLIKRKLL